MAKPKRADERNYTPEPEILPADAKQEAGPVPTLKPEAKKDEGDPFLDELEIGPEDPGVDLNEEQQR
jgi:hypothetical protein